METQLPLPQKGQSPQFLAHVYCGQMVGWIKIPLGTEVGLSQSDIVLGGDPAAPPPKRGGAPAFSAHVPVASTAGWIKMPLGLKVV